jgi:hypothetical protein
VPPFLPHNIRRVWDAFGSTDKAMKDVEFHSGLGYKICMDTYEVRTHYTVPLSCSSVALWRCVLIPVCGCVCVCLPVWCCTDLVRGGD